MKIRVEINANNIVRNDIKKLLKKETFKPKAEKSIDDITRVPDDVKLSDNCAYDFGDTKDIHWPLNKLKIKVI
ncbi:hypothetical protein BpHYR1_009423 [Brachionus plicatilis]|uniref:Uncharacterized protein n=1 Tax=Brachionus plicatilis TaxID=10195 RepID=A0A3M7R5D9_BRAPC|nr:hypothetical protein BpHYR1_009423 [Brachionus plicatilis]